MPNSKQNNKPSAELDASTMKGDTAKTLELIATGADVNALAKSSRWSPLMNAAFMGYWQLAAELLKAGADVNVSNKMGQVALAVAVHGASMAPDVKPAQRAVRDYAKVAKLLIDAGAEVNVNTWYATPLAMAEQNGFDAIAKVLRAAGGKAAYEGDEVAAVPPDLTAGEKNPAFQRIAKQIADLTGMKGQRHEGEAQSGLFFKTTHAVARPLVEKHQAKWASEGVFVFETGDGLPAKTNDRAWFGLLATSDVYDVLRVLETAGGAEGVPVVINGLKEIAKRNPFRLWFISEDTLEGEFVEDVKSRTLVAEIMESICSDVLDASALAKQLKTSRRLFLWWD